VLLDTSVGESPPTLLPPLWNDRRQAGLALAGLLADLPPDTLLLALPRGGVAGGAALVEQLGLPLATWCVRKVADPANPELAIGAVARGRSRCGATGLRPAAIKRRRAGGAGCRPSGRNWRGGVSCSAIPTPPACGACPWWWWMTVWPPA